MPKRCSTGHALGIARHNSATFVFESNFTIMMRVVRRTESQR